MTGSRIGRPESQFVVLAAGTLLLALRHHFVWAAGLAAIAGLLRFQSIAIVVPLIAWAVSIWSQRVPVSPQAYGCRRQATGWNLRNGCDVLLESLGTDGLTGPYAEGHHSTAAAMPITWAVSPRRCSSSSRELQR